MKLKKTDREYIFSSNGKDKLMVLIDVDEAYTRSEVDNDGLVLYLSFPNGSLSLIGIRD